MRGSKYYCLAIWGVFFLSLSCYVQASIACEIEQAQELQNIRHKKIPTEIQRSDRIYELIERLGKVRNKKLTVANELINWVFVTVPVPSSTEEFPLIELSPAMISLVQLGEVSVPLLVQKLTTIISEEQAEVVLSGINHILRERASAQLKLIARQTKSQNVRQAARAVLDGRERRTNYMIYILKKRLEEEKEKRGQFQLFTLPEHAICVKSWN